jgi:hypothetical protein
MAPEVSVLMSVFNGESYLKESMESILNQTFSDFEFIIVDDGSTDSTAKILRNYRDPRLVLLHNEQNIGLTRSLNRGLTYVRGDFIARQDADDVSLPYRLERQVAFLKAHPAVGILGSYCRLIDGEGRRLWLYQVPTHDLHIRWTSLLGNPFAHPSVMVRRDILTANGLCYDETLSVAQDYDLWAKILRHAQGANLSEPLILYRLSKGLTRTKKEMQTKNHDSIALRTIQQELAGFAITLEQVSHLRELFAGGSRLIPRSYGKDVALARLYLDMYETFMCRHTGEPGQEPVRQEELLRATLLFLCTPLQKGWIRMAKRLFTMHPGLPWAMVRQVPNLSLRLIRRFFTNSAYRKGIKGK